jgi:phosphoribosylformylglycinamidine synthase
MTTAEPLEGEPPATPELAAEFGVSKAEWDHAVATLGRVPTYAELGVISVMWSEHCSYKSSRVHLRRLPSTGPKVVQGPGENAGAVDIGDGYCAVFKMESHNHPSYIEPYQGAATGVGGILRDVFTMGARPVASLNSLRFGRPEHPKTPSLLRGVVEGIGGYGNCIGVPTVGGEVQFDATYDGNCLVNAFTVGVAKTDALFYGRASGVGNPVLYVGARTGRDGIHGATMASAEFGEETESKRPTVQVGDPFMEKLLLEGCLEIFATDCLEGVQDMGAAGLTSSSVEMAARAGTGIELDLDAIPRRTRRLSPYEMLLSESQERMLMVAKAGREQEVMDICAKWDLDVAVVGHVTDSGRFVCKATPGFDPLERDPIPRDPRVVVDLPIDLLADEAPKYDRPQEPVAAATVTPGPSAYGPVEDLGQELLALLRSPNIGSRRYIWRQYDHIVQNGTVLGPGKSDAAVIRVVCETAEGATDKLLALSVDCNGRHVQLDPFQGGAMAVAECARNVVCAGGEPLGLTDCLNFGNPEKPETMWRFAQAVDGLAAACKTLGIPVVSGNVSLYNETDGRPILPTPTVAVVGALAGADDRLELGFREAGHLVAVLGTPERGALGGSEWLTGRQGAARGEPVGIDLEAEGALQRCMLALARRRLVASAHDVSDGGLATALAECCLPHGLGATVTVPNPENLPLEGLLFGEEPSRIVVSLPPSARSEVEAECRRHEVPLRVVGTVGEAQLDIDGCFQLPVAELAAAHESALDFVRTTPSG